jgi:hypothetical protein
MSEQTPQSGDHPEHDISENHASEDHAPEADRIGESPAGQGFTASEAVKRRNRITGIVIVLVVAAMIAIAILTPFLGS